MNRSLASAFALLSACGAATRSPPPAAPAEPDPASEPAPDPEPEPTPAPAPAEEGRRHPPPLPVLEAGAALPAPAQEILDEHNRARKLHCAPPLVWSAKVAAAAQRWANKLRDRGCAFEHSRSEYGENLAAGTTGSMPPGAVVQMWLDEERAYDYRRGGFSMEAGHFTQVVWRGTTALGCGMSQCGGNDIWVCNYAPPGNMEGDFKANVLPKSCR